MSETAEDRRGLVYDLAMTVLRAEVGNRERGRERERELPFGPILQFSILKLRRLRQTLSP